MRINLNFLRRGTLAIFSAFVALIIYAPDIALADAGSAVPIPSLTPGTCNVSMQLLNSILSGATSVTEDATTNCSATGYVWLASSTVSTAGKLFLYFNSLVLLFAGVMLVYAIILGIIKSAESGEVLGKEWSTFWAPLRVSIGFIALFPTASGFSFVQIGMLWLAGLGVGAGDFVWQQTVDSLMGNPSDLVALRMTESASTIEAMRVILKAETCVITSNRLTGDPNIPGPHYGFNVPAFTAAMASRGGGADMYWGDISGTRDGAPLDECGSVLVRSATNWGGETMSAAMDALWGGTGERDARAIVQRAQGEGLEAARQTLAVLAEKLARPGQTEAGTVLNGPPGASVPGSEIVATTLDAAQAYQIAMLNASRTALVPVMATMTRGIKEEAQKSGWIAAGAFYYQLARITSQINAISTYVPKIQDPRDADGTPGTVSAGLPKAVNDQINAAFLASIEARSSKWESYQGGLERATANNLTNRGGNWAARKGYEWFSVDPTNETHAIVQLKNVGDTIIGAVETVIGLKPLTDLASAITPAGRITTLIATGVEKAGVSALGGALGKLTAGEKGSTAAMFGMMLAFALLGAAVMLAFWLPVAPFLMWIGAVFGWVVSVLEALLALPLWAAAHIHPDGDGFANRRAAQGYMIILEIFLRPLLMVGGLVLAFLLVDPFLRFLSALFFKAMTNANGDSLTGPVTIIAFIVIYVGLTLSIVHRAFALIHLIPNSVFKWIGASANEHGEKHDTESMKNVAVGHIGRIGSLGTGAKQRAQSSLNRAQQAEKPSYSDVG